MKVKVINKSGFTLPEYETEKSAGLDLRSTSKEVLHPGQRILIKTGLFLAIPKGYEAQVRPRSGLAIKHGITVLNSPGTIDADFRGEVGVILINLSDSPYTIDKGERIAQIVFNKVRQVVWKNVIKLDTTSRNKGGFGSTGTK